MKSSLTVQQFAFHTPVSFSEAGHVIQVCKQKHTLTQMHTRGSHSHILISLFIFAYHRIKGLNEISLFLWQVKGTWQQLLCYILPHLWMFIRLVPVLEELKFKCFCGCHVRSKCVKWPALVLRFCTATHHIFPHANTFTHLKESLSPILTLVGIPGIKLSTLQLLY